jgi:cobalt-zinc-cadmium efflux system membrane fusion protein
VDTARSKMAQAELRVGKAKARAELAAEKLARQEKLYQGRVMDMRALQETESAVTEAQIALQSAADRIRVLGADPKGQGDTLVIQAPITGRIMSRTTNVGEMASPENPMFTIANLDRVWIEADVYEKDLARVRPGQPVEIRMNAFPDRVFPGRVSSIGDILNPDTRTALVRCAVENGGAVLRGEMFVRASIVVGKRGNSVLIPREAVLDDAGKQIVFTPCMECPEDKKAGTNACGAYDKLEVTLGPPHGRLVEVLAGVQPGTKVVTAGAFQIKTAMGSGQMKAGCADGH